MIHYRSYEIANEIYKKGIRLSNGKEINQNHVTATARNLNIKPAFQRVDTLGRLINYYTREQAIKIIEERLRIFENSCDRKNKKKKIYENQTKIEDKKRGVVLPELSELNYFSTKDIIKNLKKEGLGKKNNGSKITRMDIKNTARKLNIKPAKKVIINKRVQNLYALDDVKKIIDERRKTFERPYSYKKVENKETETIQAMGDVYDRLVSLEGKMDKLIQGVAQVHLCLIPEPQPAAPQPIPEIKPEKKGFFARLFGRSGK